MKRAIAADIVDENSYLEYLNEHPVYFFGNGAANAVRNHASQRTFHRRHSPVGEDDVPVGRESGGDRRL